MLRKMNNSPEEMSVFPKVSVHIISYNRERFIGQAIESVLMQKTNFTFEIVIGEDCSMDGTKQIIVEYARKYPLLFRLHLHDRNMGMTPNFLFTYTQCRGEYIAFLDSDDYWTDRYKLQKQVDYLDSHPNVATSAHWTDVLDNSSGKSVRIQRPEHLKSLYTIDDIFEDGILFHTSSVVCRNVLKEFPQWMHETYLNDILLYILNDQYGKIGIIHEIMGVYRLHDNQTVTGQDYVKNLRRAEDGFVLFGKHLGLYTRNSFRFRFANIYIAMCEMYGRSGYTIKAIKAGYSAIKVASQNRRKAIATQAIHVSLHNKPSFRECGEFMLQVLRVIRIRGLGIVKRCCHETTYNRLKGIYSDWGTDAKK